MSRTTTANYNTETAKTEKAPVWVIKFDSIATYFCTGTFSGITSSYKKYLKNISYHSPKINVDLALTDFGNLVVEIVDVDNVFTNLIQASDKFLNTKVELYHGYQSLEIADFSQFPDHYVAKISLNSDLITYIVECRNKFFEIFSSEKKLFERIAKTHLTADLGDGVGDTTLTVYDENEFPATTTFEGTDTYLIVGGREIMRYTAKAAVGAGLDTFTVARGTIAIDNLLSEFTDGEEVIQCFKIVPDATNDSRISGYYENPILSMLWLMLDTTAGTNGEFDQGVEGWGMGVDEGLIDQYNIDRVGVEHFVGMGQGETPNALFRGFWYETINNPLQWFQEYFLKPIRGYFYMTSDSKLSLNVIDVIKLSETISLTLDDDSIVKINNIQLRYDLAINQLRITSINPITKQYDEGSGSTAQMSYKCTESITNLGESEILSINDLFIWDTWSSETYRKDMFKKFFGTWGNAPVEMDIVVKDSKNTFMSGDIIAMSSDIFPDWINQDRGISSLPALVLEQNIDNFITSYKVLLLKGLNTTDMYSITKVTTMDDSDIAYEADHTTTYADITANDAYYQNSSNYTADCLRIKLTIQPPGGLPPTNADRWTYVDLHLMCYDAAENVDYYRIFRLHYNTDWTTAYSQWIYFYWGDSTKTFKRIRIDWFNTDAPAADDRPVTITLSEIWFITDNLTIAAL